MDIFLLVAIFTFILFLVLLIPFWTIHLLFRRWQARKSRHR